MKADSIANLQNCSKSQREALEGRGQNLSLSQRPSKMNSPTFEPTACHSIQLNRSLNGSAFLPYSPLDPSKIQFFPQVRPNAFLSPRQYDLCVPEFSLWSQTGHDHSNLRSGNRFAFSRLYNLKQHPVEVTNATYDANSEHTFSRLNSIPVNDTKPSIEPNDFQGNHRRQNIRSSPYIDNRFPMNSEENLGQSIRRQDLKEIDRHPIEFRDSAFEHTADQKLPVNQAKSNDSAQFRKSINTDSHSHIERHSLQKSPIFRQILGGTTPFKMLQPSISRKSLVSEMDLSTQNVGKTTHAKERILQSDFENRHESFQQPTDWRSANLHNLPSLQTTVKIADSECSLNHSIGQQVETESKNQIKREKHDVGDDSDHSKTHSVKTSLELDQKDKAVTNVKESGTRCTCKKSKCLKLYCECFASQQICQDSCACTECFNKEEYQDVRVYFLKETLEKNPNAFKSKFKKLDKQNMTLHTRGCNCKKTGCLKRYCECYGAYTKCTSLCKCTECCNFGEESKAVEVEQYHERVLRKRKRKSRNFVQSLLDRLNERQLHDHSADVS